MDAPSEDLRRKIFEALGRGLGECEGTRTFSANLSSIKLYARMAEEGRSLAPERGDWLKAKVGRASQETARRGSQGAAFHHSQEAISSRTPFLLSTQPC